MGFSKLLTDTEGFDCCCGDPPDVIQCGDLTVDLLSSCPGTFLPGFSNYERKVFDDGDLISHSIISWQFTLPWTLFINNQNPGSSAWVPDAAAGDNIGTHHVITLISPGGPSDITTCISYQFPVGCQRTALVPRIMCGVHPDNPDESAWFCQVEMATGAGFGPFFQFWQPMFNCPTGAGWTWVGIGTDPDFCPPIDGTGVCYVEGAFSL